MHQSHTLSRHWLLAVCITLVALIPFGHAVAEDNRTVNFGLASEYGSGVRPSIAMNDSGVVVEVHESDGKDYLWYHVGIASGYGIDWGPSISMGQGGETPAVALTDEGYIIVAFQWDHDCGWPCIDSDNDLWAKVGRVNSSSKTIEWLSKQRYDNEDCGFLVDCSGGGDNPALAVNASGQVIEIHESPQSGKLWYHVGNIDGNGVLKFGGSQSLGGQGGDYPSVALTDDGLVVEVHEAGVASTALWYNTGRINGGTVQWLHNVKYDSGSSPSVAAIDNGLVLEVHKSETALTNDLWQSLYTVFDDGSLLRTRNSRFDDGKWPAVAANPWLAVQTHLGKLVSTKLWGSASLVVDRSRWMEHVPGFLDKKLWEVTLPATHDSGIYKFSNFQPLRAQPRIPPLILGPVLAEAINQCVGIQPLTAKRIRSCTELSPLMPPDLVVQGGLTQTMGIGAQLRSGIRYFDIRPEFYTEPGHRPDFYAQHEAIGPPMLEILDEIAGYMSEIGPDARELVILNMSHFSSGCEGVEPFPHGAFMDLVDSKIGRYLLVDESVDLINTPLEDLVSAGPRIILLYESDEADEPARNGFWKFRIMAEDDYLADWIQDHKEKVLQVFGSDNEGLPVSPVPSLRIFDSYANRPLFRQMRHDQYGKLAKVPSGNGHLFQLSWTVTMNPSRGDVGDDGMLAIGAACADLHTLTMETNRNLGQEMSKKGTGSGINIISVDFPEDARVTDVAIEMNGGIPRWGVREEEEPVRTEEEIWDDRISDLEAKVNQREAERKLLRDAEEAERQRQQREAEKEASREWFMNLSEVSVVASFPKSMLLSINCKDVDKWPHASNGTSIKPGAKLTIKICSRKTVTCEWMGEADVDNPEVADQVDFKAGRKQDVWEFKAYKPGRSHIALSCEGGQRTFALDLAVQ